MKVSLNHPLNCSYKLIDILKENEKFIISYWNNLIKQSNLDSFFKFSPRELEIISHQNLDWIREAIIKGNGIPNIYPVNKHLEKNLSFLIKRYLSRNIPLHQYQVANSLFRRSIHSTLKNANLGEGEYLYCLDTIENYFSQILSISSQIWEKHQKTIQLQRPELLGLYNIATFVNDSENPKDLSNVIVREVAKLLNADICFLLLNSEGHANILDLIAYTANEGQRDFPEDIKFSVDNDTLIARAFRSGSVLRSNDPVNDLFSTTSRSLEFFRFKHMLAAPLKVHNLSFGVICLGNKYNDFDSSDVSILTTISSQAASSIYNSRLVSDNESLSIEMVLSLAKLIDERDPYTHNHSANVANYATQLAKAINYPPEDYNRITMAGLLHDIGKIGIADSILHKPGRLTKMEREIMMTHAMKGAQILQPVRGLHNIIPAVKHHHENYNGSGYPGRLEAENIPFEARLLNIADSYDTMASNRVYRQAISREEIIKEFQKMKGLQFDPMLTEAFLDILPSIPVTNNTNITSKSVVPRQVMTKEENLAQKQSSATDFGSHKFKLFLNSIRSISSALDKRELIYRAVNAAQELLGADHACFWIYEDELLKPAFWTDGFDLEDYPSFTIKDSEIISYVAYRRIPVTIVDLSQEKRFKVNDYAKRNHFASAIAVAAESGERLIGVLSVYNKTARNFGADDLPIITALAEQTATAINNARILEQKMDLPNIDSLTNLYNHRFFYEQLNFEMNRSRRYNNNFSLLMLNIDKFRQYNETNGYFIGDEILKNMGELIKNNIRLVDIAARYKGEEFAVITPECRLDQAIVVAKRLRRAVATTPFPTKESGAFTDLTVSIGLIDYQIEKYESPEHMVSKAKELIKKAKKYGGNIIEYE